MQNGPELRPFEQMQRMLIGHFSAQCLHTAAVLGLADLIEEGKTSVKELASATKCDRNSIQPTWRRSRRKFLSLRLSHGHSTRLVD